MNLNSKNKIMQRNLIHTQHNILHTIVKFGQSFSQNNL